MFTKASSTSAKLPSIIEQLSQNIELNADVMLLGICIKNYNTIESLIGKSNSLNLASNIGNFIKRYLEQNLTKNFNIIFLKPYFLVLIKENDQKVNAVFYNLKHQLTLYDDIDHKLHVQFLLTYTPLRNNKNNIKDKFSHIIQLLESDLKKSGIIPYKDNIDDILLDEYERLFLLKSALQQKRARFAYQPIVDSADGNIAYYECLLRIPGKDGDLISAGPVILLAEKYGIINCVDNAVIEMAVRELEEAPDISLSVNISNIGILDDHLLTKVTSLLRSHNVASRLVIEITETSVNEDFTKTSNFVNTMRELGCRIAIDDFGVGVTSFNQLRQIKFDIIKIDGSFIRDITTNPYNRFLVELLVKLGEEVGAKTVAEFVENGEIAKFLLDSRVNFMQGNFFSPALNFRLWSKK